MTTDFRRRAVFLDVDGTLMQDGRYIPPSAIEAIRDARANGHLVFFSTGRGKAELNGALAEIGVDGAVSNGGAFATVGDDVIVSRLMTADAVADLEDRLRSHGVQWYLQSFDRMFAGDGLDTYMAAHVERDRILHEERARAAGLHPDDVEFFSVGMKVFDDREHFAAAEIAKAVILSDDADAVAAALAEAAGDFAVVSGTIPLPTGSSGEIAPAIDDDGIRNAFMRHGLI